MPFSITGFKTFLVVCNVGLLFVGTAVLMLGLKMKWALVTLTSYPVIAKMFKAIISTGFFISVAGLTGIIGGSYEILWLISVHLFFLAVIVIMEFTLGVALVFIKTNVENYIESPDCNKSCAATLDAVVLDYALPSSGLMMTIIIVEALMVYSALKLYYLLKDNQKMEDLPARVARNFQMLNVSISQSPIPHSPRPGYSPRLDYVQRAQQRYLPSYSSPRCPSPRSSPKPPDYSLAAEQQPPSYYEVAPTASRSPAHGRLPSIGRSLPLNPA